MSLYLCIFSAETELCGIDVGPYEDFNALRRFVVAELEGGAAGSRFPTLILHSDCDGLWPANTCETLRVEVASIIEEMRKRPPGPYPSEWQAEAAKDAGLVPRSACDCFVDVDGMPILEGIYSLAETALSVGQPILFQ